MEAEDRPFPFDVMSTQYTRRDVLKGALVAGAGVSLASLLAACGSSTTSSSASASSAPKKGGSLRVGIVGGSANEHLDGQLATTEPEIAITFQLYDALLGWDQNYKLVNLLAEEVTPNADATVWTVKLRQGVVFHDGTPMTADDVVYSYKRIIDPKNPKMGATQLSALKASGIQKIDASTVQFTPQLAELGLRRGHGRVRQHHRAGRLQPEGPDRHRSLQADRVSRRAADRLCGQHQLLGRGPERRQAHHHRVRRPDRRASTRSSAAPSTRSPTCRARRSRSSRARARRCSTPHTGAWQPFTMRIDVKPFNDVRVRQAFRLMIDRKAMISQAYDGYGWLGNDMYAPFDPGTPTNLPQREQDLAQAKSLLKPAGYDNNLTVTLTTSMRWAGPPWRPPRSSPSRPRAPASRSRSTRSTRASSTATST